MTSKAFSIVVIVIIVIVTVFWVFSLMVAFSLYSVVKLADVKEDIHFVLLL